MIIIITIIIIITLLPLYYDYLYYLVTRKLPNKIYLAWLRRAILPPKQYKEQYRINASVINDVKKVLKVNYIIPIMQKNNNNS